jgi:putative addiction module component (TIGR02574 family)
MTKLQLQYLHNLPVKEKIKVVQTLWNDIAKEQSIENIPLEHKLILEDRLKKINSGNAQFKSWSEIQNKYQKLL